MPTRREKELVGERLEGTVTNGVKLPGKSNTTSVTPAALRDENGACRKPRQNVPCSQVPRSSELFLELLIHRTRMKRLRLRSRLVFLLDVSILNPSKGCYIGSQNKHPSCHQFLSLSVSSTPPQPHTHTRWQSKQTGPISPPLL